MAAARMLRDWTTSDTIDLISTGAEVFFTRLIMKADDYGSFYANPKLLKSALFPLKDYSLKEIDKWVKECINANLIFHYVVDGKEYIRIINFGQRLRNMRSVFPQPPEKSYGDNSQQVAASCSKSPPELELEEEVEKEEEHELEASEIVLWPSFENFWDKYDKKVNRQACELLWEKINQGAREKIMQHLDSYVLTEKQYRKHPERYLKKKAWEDEVIIKSETKNGTSKTGTGSSGITAQGTLDRLNSYRD